MKQIIIAILIVLMISLTIGLSARENNTINRENEIRDMIRNLRIVPKPSPFSSSRTEALTEYMEQDNWGEWENNTKVSIAYDANMRIQRLLSSSWNWEGEWEENTNEIVSYRPDGKPLQVISQTWDGTEWMPNMNISFAWDGDQLQSILHQATDGNEYYTLMTQIYTYNDVSQRLEYITNEINWGDIRNWVTRVFLNWDENGRVEDISMSFWDAETESWHPAFKTEMSYHESDQSNYQVFMDFLLGQSTFGNHEMNHISSQIKVLEELEYSIDEQGQWVLETKVEYSYDANLRLTQALEYWNDEEEWVLINQEDFVYDTSGNLIEWRFSDAWDGYIDPYFRRLYTYSGVTSNPNNVSNPPAMVLNVYPNPFNPETTIYFDLQKSGEVQIEIFNLKGQKVRSLIKEVKTAGKHQIAWNGTNDRGNTMSSGVYFVRMKSGKDTVSRKIILQK